MDFDIDFLMKKLAQNIGVFESEAQFQFELAQVIKDTCQDYKVKLELTTATTRKNNKLKRLYTDIVVLDKDDNFISIELKYKTKNSEYDGIKLLNHGATDFGRFDYLWDIHRLELLKKKDSTIYEFNKNLKNCIKCFAIILTNEKNYWEISGTKKTMYMNFCISEKDVIKKGKPLSWNKKNNDKTFIDGTWRDRSLVFDNTYTFKWNPYKYDFKYLVTEIN